MIEYRFAQLGIHQPLGLSSRRFLVLVYGMMMDGLTADQREERDRDLEDSDGGSALVRTLVEHDGLTVEVARLRERIVKARTVDEKARLHIEMTTLLQRESASG